MYPKLKKDIEKEQLLEYFTITLSEKNFINRSVKRKNLLGFAVLLKVYMYLGYFPDKKSDIPILLIEYISQQLSIDITYWNGYIWKNRSWQHQISLIREHLSYQKYSNEIFNESLKEKLIAVTENCLTRKALYEEFIRQFKLMRIELPMEQEFRKLVNFSYKSFFDRFNNTIYNSLSERAIISIDNIIVHSNDKENKYSWLKAPPGKLGLNSILNEISKLRFIRKIGLNKDLLTSYNSKLITKLYKRVSTYDKSRIRDIKDEVKYTLFSVFLYVREMQLLDNIASIFIDLIKKIEKSSEKAIEKTVVKTIKKVYGKRKILKKLTFAITNNLDGNVKEVILPEVDLNTLKSLKNEFESDDDDGYDSIKSKTMKSKYSHSYRRMIKPILEELDFKTNNSTWNNILHGLEIIHKHIDSKKLYYPEGEEIPYDLIGDKWKNLTVHRTGDGTEKIRKHYFELCVLEKLEKTLRCKEIYVEGSLNYRNPCEDLPNDWDANKAEYYKRIATPLNNNDFINPIKKQLDTSLETLNEYFDKKREVYIYHQKSDDRGFFRVPRVEKQEESKLVSNIKDKVIEDYNTIDLLDILIEADKLIDFSQFFHTTAQRQILKEESIRERLLLNIFSLGTNIELKRIHTSTSPKCSYNDLLYFRNRFMNPDALRDATVALTNKILQIRDPNIWGNSTACACDGKQFTSYRQNLIASSNPHYPQTGIMVYWHVDTNSTCIYSQLKHSNSSEVISMIEGLIKHETEMKIESGYTDSRGQSEIAFAFCHFLGIELMPRFRRIKYKKLYTPAKDKSKYPNLSTVIDRTINWDLIASQYDEMVKHVVAIVEGNGSTESILRRFSSYNDSNPTYRAFKELGKAKMTIFLCKYFTNPLVRSEIQGGLNVVENWNSVNTLISYGDRYELSSNNPMIQEMTVLSLHLLQNALILVNTMLLDKVIIGYNFFERMSEKDFRSLTPLYTSNINPYGTFSLDLNKKSILEAA